MAGHRRLIDNGNVLFSLVLLSSILIVSLVHFSSVDNYINSIRIHPSHNKTTAGSASIAILRQSAHDDDLANNTFCQYLQQPSKQRDLPICQFIRGNYDYAVNGRWYQTCTAEHIALKGPITYAYGRKHIDNVHHWKDRQPYYMSFGVLARQRKNKTWTQQVRPLTYTWIPEKCNLLSLDRNDFRRQLLKRKIYIVGDSISMEMADSIDLLSNVQVAAYKSWSMLDYRTLKPMPAPLNSFCTCLENVYHQRPNPSYSPTDSYSRSELEFCWANNEVYSKTMNKTNWNNLCYIPPNPSDKLKQHLNPSLLGWVENFNKFDTFIFSLGHHIWKFGDLKTTYPVIVKNMVAWLEDRVTKDNWNGFIIYLSAPVGHVDCFNYYEPIEEFTMPTNINADSSFYDKHSWKTTVSLQTLWRDAFEQSDILKDRYAYIDLSAMYFRPDAHYEGYKNDCLHWMMPGVVDTWTLYLYHILKELNRL